MAGRKGRSGRPRKATALHVIEGTFRKKRHGEARQGEPATHGDGRLPPAPADLPDNVRKTWEMLRADLEFRIFSKEDIRSFASFASMYATWTEAMEYVHSKGVSITSTTKDGREMEVLAPQARVYLDLSSKLLPYFSRYGMTPADRSRVTEVGKGGNDGKPQKQADPDDEFGAA